jgi:hypothetical protein
VTARDRESDAAESKAQSTKRRLEDIARKPYVKGLPEWELFPDDESRRKAIETIERGMLPRSIKGVAQFLFAVALFLALPFGVSYLVTYALPPLGPWNQRIMWIMTLAGYTVIVYLAIRRDMPKALRGQLLEAGVSVCVACGYDLRGLPTRVERCPECGKKLDERTRHLMTTPAGDRTDDSGSRAPEAGPPESSVR